MTIVALKPRMNGLAGEQAGRRRRADAFDVPKFPFQRTGEPAIQARRRDVLPHPTLPLLHRLESKQSGAHAAFPSNTLSRSIWPSLMFFKVSISPEASMLVKAASGLPNIFWTRVSKRRMPKPWIDFESCLANDSCFSDALRPVPLCCPLPLEPLPLVPLAWLLPAPLPLPLVAWPLPLCDGWLAGRWWHRSSCGCRAVALLPVQLFVDGLLGQSEDLADAVVEPLGLVDQGGVEFDFQVHAGTAGTIVVVGDLAAYADVGFQGHVALLVG